jgi:hypothetical protein
MTHHLQKNHDYNFTRVGFHLENPLSLSLQIALQDFQGGKGLFFGIDTYTVEEIHQSQFETRPRNPNRNINYDVSATLTPRVGLKSIPKSAIILIFFRFYRRPTPTLVNSYGINFQWIFKERKWQPTNTSTIYGMIKTQNN